MGQHGKVGCGCLIFILIVCMVIAGIFIHPLTLKMIGKQFRYEDKVVQADIIFVPRFIEDRNGELYTESFRDYWAGNGKAIFVEEDKIFGVSLTELIQKMAKGRGIKESVVKGLEAEGGEVLRAAKIKEKFAGMGYKKIIIIVPEYASRRFHLLYNSSQGDAKVVYMIKPVTVTYFTMDRWWKEGTSRFIVMKEFYNMGFYYLARFKYGESK
ncbi:MAG: hypothetical protein PHU49_10375 [Syntrophorhabdaceae bacterium]|nr:hypothetical protein [Syntrophorhabdaceae bacterium]MDD5244411.1 hypothetical protein [Syntrophorhabdaceae bacterium]